MTNEERETLVNIKKAAETGLSCISCGNNCVQQLWQIVGLCDAALSKPARNCDFYDCKTDAETGFIDATGENDNNPIYWQIFANWLFSKAERKGEGDYIDDVLCRLKKYEELLKKSYVAFCDACGRICGEFAMENNITRKQWAHELADEIWTAINTSPAAERKGDSAQ